MQAVRLRITGRVQGVGYRAWTVGKARGRGLRGWVRNMGDGSVEAFAVGEPDAIEAFVAACRDGPRFAAVTDVAAEKVEDDGSVGFEERPNG